MNDFLSRLPGSRLARDLLLRRSPSFRGVRRHPPGHFYSPLLDLERLQTHREEFIDSEARLWSGVNLRAGEQVALLEQLIGHRESFPFPQHAANGWRYYWDNPYFRFADGF